MPNPFIMRSVTAAWESAAVPGNRVLDLSCGGGDTPQMLVNHGFRVVATEYGMVPFLGDRVERVGGVDLNEFLPFRSEAFDGVNLSEVIEHIEHQPQLIREIRRVLKKGGVAVISTPNVLNVFSRVRFLFSGFLRGRVRPVRYDRGPGQAPNIYLIHFYELYYLFFHYGFEIVEIRKTKVKFAPLFFTIFLYPWMWLSSVIAVIGAEKDPVQRRLNWGILRLMFAAPVLLSDNLVVKVRKKSLHENRPGAQEA